MAAFKTTEYSQVSKLKLINAFLHRVLCCPMCRVIMDKAQIFLAINMQFSRPFLILYEYELSVNVSQVTLDGIKLSIYFSSYPCMSARMLSSYPWVSTGIRGFSQISVNVISVSVDVKVRVRLFSIILYTSVLHKLAHRPDSTDLYWCTT